jgi:tetratricopeptide (TPR) repeat protein
MVGIHSLCMPKYIWKARDRDGRQTAVRVEADTAKQAREQLEARGLTDLRLQQDEVALAAAEGVRQASDPEFDVELTPEEAADSFDGKAPGFWSQWLASFKEVPKTAVLWLALLGLSIYSGRTWLIVLNSVVVAFSFLPVLLFPLLNLWFGRTQRLYDRLNRAKVWSRWPEVYALAGELDKAGAATNIGVPAWEIARCKAQALAGMGRLEEAVKLFERFSHDSTLERWMYLSHLAGIYVAAQEYERALALRLESSELKPDNMGTLIDLAMHHAHHMGDAPSARRVFARIDHSIVPELGKPYLELVEGMMLCGEGKFGEAQAHLRKAEAGLQPYRHNPLVESVILLTQSYLCLSLAGAGSTREVSPMWQRVKTYLKAGREDALLNRIQQFLGSRAA